MRSTIIIIIFFSCYTLGISQSDTISIPNSEEVNQLFKKSKQMHLADSVRKADLLDQISTLKKNQKLEKAKLEQEIKNIQKQDSVRKTEFTTRFNILKKNEKGYPVTLYTDTLFILYTKIGSSTPYERSSITSFKIHNLYSDDFFVADSLTTSISYNTIDIVYKNIIILSISEQDAMWHNKSKEELANEYSQIIKETVIKTKSSRNIWTVLSRIGLAILVITGISLLIWGINTGHKKTQIYFNLHKQKFLKELSYKDYTFLTADQELKLVNFVFKIIKWFFVVLSLYLVLPMVFSIFPFSRSWANILFALIWSPFKGILISLWDYLPNLFSIFVIFFVMKYFIRFVKYIFQEIAHEKLKIPNFHTDWAMPTYGIVRFLLYAFMFVLIFPYLPGSDSNIFKGVSVFIGILFSLGSSTAIANMIAGLVITYMRPFKINDRIKIGDMTGDVIEKTLLVTRLRTIKNEEITIPNASVLSGNTINYSTHSKTQGLIIHTTITIGYDVAWRKMHQVLIDAALRTEMILKDPLPFVLQSSLDDFYVSYQINAYTQEANKQALIYSELHKNIQDICFENGIEILSPHYKSLRDGNLVTIPNSYLKDDYQSPTFNVTVNKNH